MKTDKLAQHVLLLA